MCEGFSISRDCRLRKESVQLMRDLLDCLKSHSGNRPDDPALQAFTRLLSNIAAGFAQMSAEDFIQFLYFAKGSCAEIQHRLDWARTQNFITPSEKKEFHRRLRKISAMLYVLITSQPSENRLELGG